MHLSRALVEAANLFDVVAADTRIGPLLKVGLISLSLSHELRLFLSHNAEYE
jgi:hypothetical protein